MKQDCKYFYSYEEAYHYEENCMHPEMPSECWKHHCINCKYYQKLEEEE